MKVKSSLPLLLGGALMLALILLAFILMTLHMGYKGYQEGEKFFKVPAGQGLGQVALRLEQEGLIRSATFFKATALAMGKGRSIKKGSYRFQGEQSLWQVLTTLDEGKEVLVAVTIPEGYRMTEIFELLRSKGIKNGGDYARLAEDEAFLQSLKLPFVAKSLEGLLYPETYFFPEEADEKQVLIMMTETFLAKLPADYADQAKKVGLSAYEAVILASIVEKETGKGAERPLISSVFHNRLKKGMKLQTDPTVIYGIKNYKGNIRRKHLRQKHPYNTYVIEGLPPGPIASPGLHALMAAVRPETSQYLFFVAKGDGSHEFTSNLKDHNKAVEKYQLRRVKNYRSY